MKLFKRSSMAIADQFIVKMGQAIWNIWTVRKAVKEGYKASGWVYAAVRQIVNAASNVELVVYDKNNVQLPEHPLSVLLANPCKSISGQDFLELIIAWLQLTGRAPFKKIKVGSRTRELQLISPDRIAPIASKEIDSLVTGYEIDGKYDPDLMPESICYLRLIDPANPLNGISPLEAAARAVDCDYEQQQWNKSAMQNRGVVDGVFTFKKDLTQTLGDAILAKIKDKFGSSGAVREPLVLGSEASYTRMGLDATEMDFIESRKFNREEIFITYNVPLALVSSDSMTYNNYTSALRILYESNVIPLLMDICSEMNFSFQDELRPGEYIGPDLTNIPALKDQDSEKVSSSKMLWDMGVPISVINERMELNLSEFPNWDQPWSGFPPRVQQQMQVNNRTSYDVMLKPLEKRNIQNEIAARENIASGPVKKMFTELLSSQREAVMTALKTGSDVVAAVNSTKEQFIVAMDKQSRELALHFSKTFVTNSAGGLIGMEVRTAIDDEISNYLVDEAYTLNEVSLMNETTAANVVSQVKDGIEKDKTIQEIAQAIDDVGTFSEARALMLARTLTGTAQSIGQLSGAKVSGAETKTWVTAGFNVRDLHVQREGVSVGIEDTWNNGPAPIRFPLDPNVGPEDRVNCRCAMTFK